MDNLTHTFTGLVLARTPLGRASPFATPAMVVAANLPDIDIVSRVIWGAEGYLRYHRGITHGLCGIVVLALAFSFVVSRCERRFGRADETSPGTSPGGLFLSILVALISHPILDFLNIYGVRPWLPFAETRYYGDLVFVVDPWLWLMLGFAATIAVERRTRVGDLLLTAMAVAGLVVIYGVARERAPLALRVVVGPAAVVAALLRYHGIGVRNRQAIVAGGALLVAIYLTTLAASRARAERVGLAAIEASLSRDESIVGYTPVPAAARPLQWTILAETTERFIWQPVDAEGDPGPPVSEEKGLDHPAVAKAAASPTGQTWLYFAKYPRAVVASTPEGKTVVTMTDARYDFTDFCTLRYTLP